MHFRPHRTRACNYMHIWVHGWRNACRILFRCGDTATTTQISEAQIYAQEQYLLAAVFLPVWTETDTASSLKTSRTTITQGQDNYPKTVTAAYSLLTNWK
jgi:hypothetical protein